MAKRIAAKSMIQIWFGGGEEPEVRAVGYSLDDDTNPDIYYNSKGMPTGAAASHTLKTEALGAGAGSLAAFIADIEDDIKAAEGIV